MVFYLSIFSNLFVHNLFYCKRLIHDSNVTQYQIELFSFLRFSRFFSSMLVNVLNFMLFCFCVVWTVTFMTWLSLTSRFWQLTVFAHKSKLQQQQKTTIRNNQFKTIISRGIRKTQLNEEKKRNGARCFQYRSWAWTPLIEWNSKRRIGEYIDVNNRI